jgi:hypothetical protein
MEDRVREALEAAEIAGQYSLADLLSVALDPEQTQRTSPMVGRKEAAEILGVGRGNLTKSWVNMPPPEGRTAAGPYWLESDIRALAASPEHAERIAKREAGR